MRSMLRKTPWDQWPVWGAPESHPLNGNVEQRIHPDRTATQPERDAYTPCRNWLRQEKAAPNAARRAASNLN